MMVGEHPVFFALQGPLAPAPSRHQTKASHLQGFADLLHRGGLSPAGLLERGGIDPTALRDTERYIGCVPLMDTIALCREALDAPLFGLDLALGQPQLLGFLASLCKTAPDLTTAIECLCAYSSVMHSPECRMTLKVGHSTSEVRCGSWLEHPGLDQVMYGGIVTVLKLCEDLTAGHFRPRYVLLKSRPKVAEIERLEHEYGCTVHTGQPHDAIGFPTEALGMVVATGDRISHRLLRDYADSVRATQRRSLLARVEDFIRGSVGENCTLPRCAAALGVPSRRLQLELDRQSVTFTDLLARQREDMARALLAADDADLGEVALRLGYSDQTSFGRAFRRWTGQSPGAFKAQVSTNRRS